MQNILNEFIPLENRIKENNCFINVVIQLLSHSQLFMKKFLSQKFEDKNNPLNSLQILLNDYKNLMYSTEIKRLDIKNFRKNLIKLYNNYHEGTFGDSIEILNNIFNIIHSFSLKSNLNIENNKNCNPLCISHDLFSLKITELITCKSCNKKKSINYDNNYFIYEIFSFELLELLFGKKIETFQNKLFTFQKNIINRDFQGTIEGCRCLKKDYIKNLYLTNPQSNYFLINLTWDNYLPKLTDVCKMYNLIPLIEENKNLFQIDEKRLIFKYYLYGIIVFYNYHYACCLKSNKNRHEWYFISDYDIVVFDNYKELIRNLIINHYHPVILFYTKNRIVDNENKENTTFENFEYESLYFYCKEQLQKQGIEVPISRQSSSNSPIFNKKSESDLKALLLYKNSKKNLNSFNNNNIIEKKNSNDSITKKISFSKEDFWFCPNCRKKNMIQSSNCWNCHYHFENSSLKEGNDLYVNYFQEEEKEEEIDKGNIKNYINPLKNFKNLTSNSEFNLEDLNSKDFLNSDKNNNITNLKNKKNK